MRLVDLAVFAGCYTGYGDNNIAKYACQNGAKISIGWETEVKYPYLTKWLKGFNGYLAKGYSVNDALWEIGFSDINISYGVFNWKVYTYDPSFYVQGNLNLQSDTTVPMASDRIDDEVWSENLLDSYDGNRMISGEDIASEVSDVLRQIKDDYQDEDYRVYLHDHNLGQYHIRYAKVVGGFETDSRYVAGVRNNLLDRIYDQTKEISPEAEARLLTLSNQLGITASIGSGELDGKSEWPQQSEQLAEALRLAWEKVEALPEKEPYRQKYNFCYDVEQDRPYISISTVYYYNGASAVGVDDFEYDLEGGVMLP